MSDLLLAIKNLRTYFHTDIGVVKAVDDLNVTVKSGQTLGIVGESGSGKIDDQFVDHEVATHR